MRSHLVRRPILLLAALAATALAACSDSPTEEEGPDAFAIPDPSFGVFDDPWAAVGSCPLPSDVVVSDQDALFDALGDADPGDVIGIHGIIALDETATIDRDGVTLTCATPGSGLAFVGDPDDTVLRIESADVTVTRLVLDGSDSRRPIFAFNNGSSNLAHAPTISHNDITCGWANCMLTTGVQGVEIRDNRFLARETVSSGVHIQGHGPFAPDGSRPRTIDGARIVNNTVLALVPNSNQAFGGIRVRDGSGVTVGYNLVGGVWQNSISVDDLQASSFLENELYYAIQYGIVTGLNSPVVAGVRANDFDENTVVGAGEIGIWVVSGCSNQIRHNQLWNNGTDGIDGIRFSNETGDNLYVGDLGVVDAETGEYDCDGDGLNDPNFLVSG